MTDPPSRAPRTLVDLMSEIEIRLTGSGPTVGLGADLGDTIGDVSTIVVVLFDGLGVAQLADPRAAGLAGSMAATLQADFPTTTSTSLATVATGSRPAQHGVVAHLTWMPEHRRVVNTLKWVDLAGAPVDHEYESLLPAPNLWERLRRAGVEPITVQPGDFRTTPLTRALYRGARFEGIWGVDDLIDATVQLASQPRRFIFTYVPQIDYAGHVHGFDSEEFSGALATATRIWDEIRHRLPQGAALIGTADHGLIEYPEDRKLLIRDRRFDQLRFAGDPRGLHLWCGPEDAEALREMTGGDLVDPLELLGPDPAPSALERIGSQVLLAPQGFVLLPRGFDKRLRAYHGGIDPREVEIPLLAG